RFSWTVIDGDRLLPHNLARHVARGDRMRQLKANILADHINSLFGDLTRSTPISASLFADGEQGAAIDTSLREADLIIDASASVVVPRYLSDHAAQGRRASVFFNPAAYAAAAAIIIWTIAPNGEVTVDTTAPEPVMRFQVDAWQIAIDAGLVERIRKMRAGRVPCETGGILLGLVDIPAQRIHLVDASPAPPDSVEQPGSFVRGVVGVPELIDSVRRRTADQ